MPKPEWWDRWVIKVIRKLEWIFISDYPAVLQLGALIICLGVIALVYFIKSRWLSPVSIFWAGYS